MRTPGTCFLTISPPLPLVKKVRIPRCRLCFSRCFPLCSSCKHLPVLPRLCKTSFANTQILTAPPTKGDAGWAGAKILGLYGMLPSPPSAVLSSLLHPQSVSSLSSASPYLYVSKGWDICTEHHPCAPTSAELHASCRGHGLLPGLLLGTLSTPTSDNTVTLHVLTPTWRNVFEVSPLVFFLSQVHRGCFGVFGVARRLPKSGSTQVGLECFVYFSLASRTFQKNLPRANNM